MAAPRKSTAKTPERAKSAKASKPAPASVVPEKVPQPHGGALNRGGTPGNKGGTGRPPNALREEMRGDLAEVLIKLRQKVDYMDVDELQKYGALLARFGLGTSDELSGKDGAPLQPVVFRVAPEGMIRGSERPSTEE